MFCFYPLFHSLRQVLTEPVAHHGGQNSLSDMPVSPALELKSYKTMPIFYVAARDSYSDSHTCTTAFLPTDEFNLPIN